MIDWKSSIALFAALALGLSRAEAVDKFWNNGTASYNNAGFWTPAGVPGGGDNVFNDNGLANIVQINAADPAWTVNDIRAGTALGTSGSFEQNGSTVTLNAWMRLGTNAGVGAPTGRYTLNSGILNINAGGSNLYVGESGNGNAAQAGVGILNINGGTLNKGGGGVIAIGNAGTGTLNMTNGAINASSLIIFGDRDTGFGGNPDNASGTANHSGGTITSSGEIWIGQGTGGIGTAGTYNLSGTGVINANNWTVVGRAGATGLLAMTGGNIVKNGTGAFIVGDGNASVGTFNHSAGTVTSAGEFWVGQGGGSNGTYNLSGSGDFNANNWFVIGRAGGTGLMTMTGGTLDKAGGGNLIVGDNSMGTLTQSGGTITSSNEVWVGQGGSGNGTYNLSGTGQMDVSNWLAVGRAGATGLISMTGGTLNKLTATGNITIGTGGGTGTVTQSGGNFNNTASQTWLGEGGTGIYNISGTGVANLGVVVLAHSGTSSGTVNLNAGGTFAATQIGKGTGTTATFNFNGGSLRANATNNLNFMTGLNAANVNGGGAIVDTNTFDITIAQALLNGGGGGGLTKNGAGVLTLTGASTFTGNIVVNGGSLTAALNLNNAGTSGPLGNSQVAGRSITLNNASTLNFNAGNVLGTGSTSTLTSLTINQGSSFILNAGDANIIGNVTINGGTITTGNSYAANAGYHALILTGGGGGATPGTVTVGGITPSTINTTGVNSNGVMLGAQGSTGGVNFNVADVTGNANVDLTVSAPLVGTPTGVFTAPTGGTLIKSGAGTMALTAFNTYTGGTTVNAGTLALGVGGGTGAIRGTLNINVGANVQLNAVDALGFNAGVAVTQVNINGGTLNNNVNGNNSYLASWTLTGGTMTSTGGDTYHIRGGSGTITSIASPTTSAINANIAIRDNNTNLVIDVADHVSAATDFSISGAIGNDPFIGGSANGITKLGAGLLSLTGANTYTGPTLIRNGTLVVDTGGSITNTQYLSAGQLAGDTGTLTVQGTGQITTLDFNVSDISGSTGFFNMNGGTVTIGTLYVGKGNGGAGATSGTVTQTGGTVQSQAAGGEWRIGGGTGPGDAGVVGVYNISNGILNAGAHNFQVGAFGNGTVNQTGGAVSTTGFFAIGRFGGGVGLYDISAGSLTANTQGLTIVGENGTGTLTVSGTGTVNASNLSLALGGGGVGTVNLNGGAINASAVSKGTGTTATFNFNGGTLRATGNNLTFMQGLNSANVNAGGAVIDSNGFGITVAQPLLNGGGGGGLTKAGAGTLTLTGNNTYAGNTNVNVGTLALSNANNNNIANSAVIHVATGANLNVTGLGSGPTVNDDLILASGQTLTGGGTVIGNTTIASGSTVSAGNSPGTTTFAGNQTWAGGGTNLFQIDDATGAQGGDPGWDFLDISGSLTISATAANKFTIDIDSLLHPAHTPGDAVNFDEGTSYSWTIATADGGINLIGADAFSDRFLLDTSGFSNDIQGNFSNPGFFTISQDGDNVVLNFNAAIPEPATIATWCLIGVVGLGCWRWKARRRSR